MIRITIAVAARGANMATRFKNDSTVNDSVTTCHLQANGPDCPFEHSENVRHDNLAQSANDVVRKPTIAKQLMLLATLGFLLYPALGCTMVSGLGSSLAPQETLDNFLVNYRNQAWAAKAWHCRKHKFCNKRYLSDYERGFRDGYASVAQGGNGCVPAVCPQSYWGWQYQAADGQARMNAWFEAFPLGVQAAEQDGIGGWGQLRTSMAYPAPPAAMPAGMGPGAMPAGGMPMGAMPMGAVPLGAAPMAGMGAQSRFSDQTEVVQTPDPVPSSSKAKTPEPNKKVPKAPKTTVKSLEQPGLETTVPGLTKPEIAAPRDVDAAPKADSPAPKADAAVPQPNEDPFGFQ